MRIPILIVSIIVTIAAVGAGFMLNWGRGGQSPSARASSVTLQNIITTLLVLGAFSFALLFYVVLLPTPTSPSAATVFISQLVDLAPIYSIIMLIPAFIFLLLARESFPRWQFLLLMIMLAVTTLSVLISIVIVVGLIYSIGRA